MTASGEIRRYLRAALDPATYAARIERLLLARREAPRAPVLLILGLPRSGTTLVYQYLVHRLRLAYFTNGAGRFHRAPCLATRVQRRIHGEYRSDFRSEYGRVSGPLGPREAGAFWGRSFGFEEYVRFDDLDAARIDVLRRTVACVQTAFDGAAFVNKNVKHLLRVDALARVYPQSLFLVVERDLGEVALSMYRAWLRHAPGPGAWWSVRPPDAARLSSLPLVERVAGQAVALKDRLDADLSALAADRVVRLAYEGFCDGPDGIVRLLRTRLGDPGDRNPAVARFERSRGSARNADEERLLRVVRDVA